VRRRERGGPLQESLVVVELLVVQVVPSPCRARQLPVFAIDTRITVAGRHVGYQEPVGDPALRLPELFALPSRKPAAAPLLDQDRRHLRCGVRGRRPGRPQSLDRPPYVLSFQQFAPYTCIDALQAPVPSPPASASPSSKPRTSPRRPTGSCPRRSTPTAASP